MAMTTRFWKKVSAWFTAPAKAPPAPPPRDFESDLERFYRALLRPGDTVLDIGAHLGRHTWPLAEVVGPAGKVYAFEPLARCREQLDAHLAGPGAHLRDRVEVRGVALGAASGDAGYVVAVDLLAYSGLRPRVYDAPTRLEKVPVRVETLDGHFAALKRCRFVKADTEGGEYDVFRGGIGLLRRLRPVVGFEFGLNGCASYGVTTREMGELWDDLGYDLFDITGRALGVAEFAHSATVQKVWDYLAVPREDGEARAAVRQACWGE